MNQPALCIECGYQLAGRRVGDLCPECGRVVPDVPLAGGLAAGGARFAKRAARLAAIGAVLACVGSAARDAGVFGDFGPRTGAVLATVAQQSRAGVLVVGVLGCALLARMLPAGSPWARVMWIATVSRTVLAIWLEVMLHVPGAQGPLALVLYRHEVSLTLAVDLLAALAAERAAATGGLSRASAAPAFVAAGAAGLGWICAEWGVASGSTWASAEFVPFGAIGAVAYWVALRRIAREVHGVGRAR